MSRIVVISGTEGERRIDYSVLTSKEIDHRLRAYQRQHGSFRKFLYSYDCESSPPEDSVALIDWESLLAERKERKRSAGKSGAGARKKPSGNRGVAE
jgi:hypothetical protein